MKQIIEIDSHQSKIELTQGYWALVSNDDLPLLQVRSWHIHRNGPKLYAKAWGKNGSIYMHRAIMGLVKGSTLLVDHRNGDGLDNRRENLRLATPTQNAWNSAGRSGCRTCSERGVTLREHPEFPFRAYIYDRQGKYVHLGYFSTEEEAVASRRETAAALHGEFAWSKAADEAA